MLSPEVDIANALVAATSIFSPALVLKTNSIAGDVGLGPPRAPLGPNNSTRIWVMAYSSPEPEPLVNAAVDGSIYPSKVQVLVRSPPDDYASGLALARKVRNALHTKHTSAYISWTALSSEPNYLPPDEVQEHRWTVNILAKWQGVV